MALIFFTSTHHPVKFWVGLFTQKMQTLFENKKLSCRRETARRFVSWNILISHSRSLKVIRN